MGKKQCSSCKNFKPLSSFEKAKGCKDGHRNKCRNCVKEIKHQYYLKNKEDICRKNEERRQKNLERDKKVKRDNYLRNIEKYKERARLWELNNTERKKERNKKYRIEKPELGRARDKKYRENNKDKSRIRSSRRRARVRNLPFDFTEQEWKECLEFFNHECAYCGTKKAKLAQEHVVPVAKGGPFTKDNIVPSCKRCNTSKLDKDFFEWYRIQDYFSQERESKVLNYLTLQNPKPKKPRRKKQ